MSVAGVVATRLLVDDTLRVVQGLSADDWGRASACPGWRVQDVIVHMASFFGTISGDEQPSEPTGLAERINDAAVRERAHWTPDQAREYYEQKAAVGSAVLEALQKPENAGVEIPLAELGTYRLSELSNTVAFDHLVHLSSDILVPFGPVEQPPVPMDAARLGPALDWMLAGLPQMCGAALHPLLTRPIGLRLDGPAGRNVVIRRSPDAAGKVEVEVGAPLPDDVVGSSTVDFLRWATTRTGWGPVTKIDGDPAFAEPVLNAVDIV